MSSIRGSRSLFFRLVPGILVAVIALMPASGNAYERPEGRNQVDYAPGGSTPEGTTFASSMTPDARFVAFETDAPLNGRDVNQATDVHVRDMASDRFRRASLTLQGGVPLGSANASCTAILRNASRQSTTATGYSGAEGPWQFGITTSNVLLSWDPAISANGRFVAFTSYGINLVPGDINLAPDVFLYDRQENSLVGMVSGTPRMPLENGEICPASWSPSIDRKGNRITFTSLSRLVPEDKNAAADIYLYERKTKRLKLVSKTSAEESCELEEPAVPVSGVAPGCGIHSKHSSISLDGRFVAFQSEAPNLVEGDTNEAQDVFVARISDGKIERVSVDSNGGQLGDSRRDAEPFSVIAWTDETLSGQLPQHSISGDGRYVLFYSNAWDVVPNPDPGDLELAIPGVYVHDRRSGRTERVNVTAIGRAGPAFNAEGGAPGISSDGRVVVYSKVYSRGPCPALPVMTCSSAEVIPVVYDRRAGSPDHLYPADTTEAEITCDPLTGAPATGYPAPTAEGWLGDISGDGRYISLSICRPELLDHRDGKTYRNHVVRFDRGAPTPTAFVQGKSSGAGKALAARGIAPGAKLFGAAVVLRPDRGDLYATIDLQHMPRVTRDAAPFVYGLRFESEGREYEVRATSLRKGTFGLFDCTDLLPTCSKTATLQGGYGTTGERIVVSIPLDAVGSPTGMVEHAEAFSALGGLDAGAVNVVDRVQLERATQ